MMTRSPAFLLPLLGLLLAAPAVAAGEPRIADYREEMVALEGRLNDLEGAKTSAQLRKAIAGILVQARLFRNAGSEELGIEAAKDPVAAAQYRDWFDQIIRQVRRLEAVAAKGKDGALTPGATVELRRVVDELYKIEDLAHEEFEHDDAAGEARAAIPNAADSERQFPIERTRDARTGNPITGDEGVRTAHELTWHSALNQVPQPSERARVVVIGGGMSGLQAAHELVDLKPVVLEQAPRLGGLSRGESWKGIDYSIGAAYIDPPQPGTVVHRTLSDLGMLDQLRKRLPKEDPVYFDLARRDDVWTNGVSPESKAQFNRLRAYFEDMADGRNGRIYPQIPPPDAAQRAYVKALDATTFREHLEKFLGEPLHSDVAHVLTNYCRSALGGELDKISAAVGLNFYVGDLRELAVAQGGNPAITDALARRVTASLPAGNVRTDSFVTKIRVLPDGSGVAVTYATPDGKFRTIAAESVVVAAPKYVVGHVLEDIEPERLRAIREIEYAPYVVGNVLLERKDGQPLPLDPKAYDSYFVYDRKEPSGFGGAVTDVVIQRGPEGSPANRAVLTLYQPAPASRSGMIGPRNVAELTTNLDSLARKDILPAMGLDPAWIQEIRMARYGHAIPVAAAGARVPAADGVSPVDRVSAPFKGRVFFVGQDNLRLPGVESLMATAHDGATQVRALLTAKSGSAGIGGASIAPAASVPAATTAAVPPAAEPRARGVCPFGYARLGATLRTAAKSE